MSQPAVAALWQLLNRCWSKEPEERPQMSEVMIQVSRVRLSILASDPQPVRGADQALELCLSQLLEVRQLA